MSLLKKLFFNLSSAVPFSWSNTLAGTPVLFPYHHVVSDDYLPHIRGLYNYKNKKQFLQDLEWLLKKYKPVHPNQIADAVVQQKPLPENSFLLSFDDGFREVAEIVAPILLSKGIPALFFINPSFIDNKELFYRSKLSLVIEKLKEEKNKHLMNKIVEYLGFSSLDNNQLRTTILKINYPNRIKADELGSLAEISFEDFLSKNQPFLTTSQVSQLHEQGFTIGSHSMDHPHYATIPLEDQINQTLNSMQFVNQLVSPAYTFFSFPHEDQKVNQSFFNRVLDSDGKSKRILFGVQNQLEELNNNMLHRFNAENPEISISQKLKSCLLYLAISKTFNRSKILRD